MKLTEKKAVKLSMDMWRWLSETGKPKDDYPQYEKFDIDLMESDCPCCEYYRGLERICALGKCPLKKDSLCGFAEAGSAYWLWETAVLDYSDFDTGKKQALRIYKALAKYYNKKWGKK